MDQEQFPNAFTKDEGAPTDDGRAEPGERLDPRNTTASDNRSWCISQIRDPIH